jgi:hypothetical protein
MSDVVALQAQSIKRVVGPTILLGSGSYFDFEAPEQTPLTIEDVAYGLAYACRFAGQCYSKRLGRRVFYSVADHCEIMSRLVPEHLAYDALMHELGEPTCGDMTGPLKSIVPQYKAIEKRCEKAAQRQFGVTMTEPETIKLFDLRMLATERRDLMNWADEEWACVQGAEPFDIFIEPRSPDEAAAAFLRRFNEIAPARS